ncbi:MAG: site-2 protease family protein [Acidobacteria bacterium]|nr:site-2 protease family protein [Acidobacteriota bacterium]
MELILQITALIFSVIFHEVAHGYVAYRLGDPTARDANRLTLNPLAHIDLMGSVLLPLILILAKSPVLFGWAKPVPFNPGYFRNVKKGVMLVGLAGPASNLIVAVVAAFIYRIFSFGGLPGLFLLNLCIVNVILALFNLIPIPPLDGSRVAIGFLPSRLISPYLKLESYGFIIIFGLLWLGALDYVLWPIASMLFRFLMHG